MKVLEFLGANMNVILPFILGIITTYYAHLTRKSQKLVEKLIDNPKVVASLRNDEVNSSCLIVCIENVGTGTARDVQFQTEFTNLEAISDITLGDIGFIKKGIGYFGSGQKYEFLVNTIRGEDAWNELMQTPLEITITYRDSSGKELHEENAYLDFGIFEKMPLVKSPIGAIAENTKDMAKSSGNMVKATNAIVKELNQYTRRQ